MLAPLTAMARGAGCGCKLGKDVLTEALRGMPLTPSDANVLVGHEGFDDAAVYRLRDDLCVVATVDFFTLAAILRGGAEAAQANGCPVLGGHSVDDPEPKYGLAAIGTAHPERLMTNDAGLPGQVLVLTKPIGVGIVMTAARAGAAPRDLHQAAVVSMLASNGPAAEAALEAGVRCATDVTGFGLVGHLGELALASGVGAVLDAERVPLLEGVLELAGAGHVSGGGRRNRGFAADFLVLPSSGLAPNLETALCDPQTSGGLLLALAPDRVEPLLAGLAERGIEGVAIGRLESGPAGRVRVAGGWG